MGVKGKREVVSRYELVILVVIKRATSSALLVTRAGNPFSTGLIRAPSLSSDRLPTLKCPRCFLLSPVDRCSPDGKVKGDGKRLVG